MAEAVMGGPVEEYARETVDAHESLKAELESLNEDAEYLPGYRVGNKVASMLKRHVGGNIDQVLEKLYSKPPARPRGDV